MINVIFAFLIGAIIVGLVLLWSWMKNELQNYIRASGQEISNLYRDIDASIKSHEDRWHRRSQSVRYYSPNYCNVKPPYDRPHNSEIFKADKVPPIDKKPEQEVYEDPEDNEKTEETIDDIQDVFN